ncbi:MAG: glycosyltransferase family 4 protein [Proteobacteria bacterium]|nr:glycosyltransferase family 4 protein [Pseudomonadota bacterium]
MPESGGKRIGIYTEGPAFDGRTPNERALGGSETALVQAAKALADLGHQVTVYNNCPEPVAVDGVRYRPRRDIVLHPAGAPFDVLIVSRFFRFFQVPVPARLRVLWNHDTLDRPASLRALSGRIDVLFVLSCFHRDNFLTRAPELGDRIIVTRNGLDLALIDSAVSGASKRPDKVIYASRPERGLQVLLESIWPRLKEKRPELTLYLCGYHVGRDDLVPGLAELYDYLDMLIKGSPGVVSLGHLPKREYYRHLAESTAMLYPCTFPEISCIAALEAQACRTPILTTDGFALSETVIPSRYRIPGRPGSEAYDRDFVDRADRILSGREQDAAARARAVMEERFTWPTIVSEWDRVFDLMLSSRRSSAGRRQERESPYAHMS